MKKLWQTKWFDIKFKTFTKVDPHSIADEKFYQKFYQAFYQKYHSFEDLPEKYQRSKLAVASDILSFSKSYKSIMSIGCGNGIIENYIINNDNKFILAIEPTDNTRWLDNKTNIKLLQGFFPEIVLNEPKVEFGYCSNIDYVFNDQQYIDFLKNLHNYNFKEFYFTDVITPTHSLKHGLKTVLLEAISIIGIPEAKGQLWGYLRTINEHVTLMKKAGFTKLEFGRHEHGSYWIRLEGSNNEEN